MKVSRLMTSYSDNKFINDNMSFFNESISFSASSKVRDYKPANTYEMTYYQPENKTELLGFLSSNSITKIQTEKSNNKRNEIESLAIQLLNIVKQDNFVEGETSKTELYLENLYLTNVNIFFDVLNKCWLRLYTDSPSNLSTLISVLSTIDYEWFGDKVDALIIAAAAHDNYFVCESCIRAFEAWEQPQHAEYLENIRDFNIIWLDNYKRDVINYLKSL